MTDTVVSRKNRATLTRNLKPFSIFRVGPS